MLSVLNIIAFNLTARIVFDLSAGLSILYFIISMFQLVHIFWDYKYPSYDWQYNPGRKRKPQRIKYQPIIPQIRKMHIENLSNQLHAWFWAGVLVVVLLVIIFPLLHI